MQSQCEPVAGSFAHVHAQDGCAILGRVFAGIPVEPGQEREASLYRRLPKPLLGNPPFDGADLAYNPIDLVIQPAAVIAELRVDNPNGMRCDNQMVPRR